MKFILVLRFFLFSSFAVMGYAVEGDNDMVTKTFDRTSEQLKTVKTETPSRTQPHDVTVTPTVKQTRTSRHLTTVVTPAAFHSIAPSSQTPTDSSGNALNLVTTVTTVLFATACGITTIIGCLCYRRKRTKKGAACTIKCECVCCYQSCNQEDKGGSGGPIEIKEMKDISPPPYQAKPEEDKGGSGGSIEVKEMKDMTPPPYRAKPEEKREKYATDEEPIMIED